MKKTIVITGASSGFGLMIARSLHNSGHTVIGTSREPDKYQHNIPFKLLKLDIDNENSVLSFAQKLMNEIGYLDVLINNAGYMMTGLAEETSIESGKKQFETNFWGTVRVTNALLPLFRKQKTGKIITVSSIVGLIGPPNLSYYTASKHAVEGYFKSLRFELEQFNIKVSMVEPVWFKTNLAENAIISADSNITDYDNYRPQAQAATQKGINDAKDPDAVISKVIQIIEAKEPKFSNPVGAMTGMILFLQNYLPKVFENSILKSVRTAK